MNDNSESNSPKVVVMADTGGSMFGDKKKKFVYH